MAHGWQVPAGALGLAYLRAWHTAPLGWFLVLRREWTSPSDPSVLVLVVWPYQQGKAPLNKSAAIWRDNEIQHPPRLLSMLNCERFRAQFCPAKLSLSASKSSFRRWWHSPGPGNPFVGMNSCSVWPQMVQTQEAVLGHWMQSGRVSHKPVTSSETTVKQLKQSRKHWTSKMGMGWISIRSTSIFCPLQGALVNFSPFGSTSIMDCRELVCNFLPLPWLILVSPVLLHHQGMYLCFLPCAAVPAH